MKIRVSSNFVLPLILTVLLVIIKYTIYDLPLWFVLLPIILYLGLFCIVIFQLLLSMIILFIYKKFFYGFNNNKYRN